MLGSDDAAHAGRTGRDRAGQGAAGPARLLPAARRASAACAIFHTPWLFRIPGFRRFTGYEFGPLILIKRPLEQTSDDLIVHELCHVWQSQHRHIRMWVSYLYQGYRNNPHEVEAREAARSTR